MGRLRPGDGQKLAQDPRVSECLAAFWPRHSKSHFRFSGLGQSCTITVVSLSLWTAPSFWYLTCKQLNFIQSYITEEAGRSVEIVSIMLVPEIHPQGAQTTGTAGSVSPKHEASVTEWTQQCQVPSMRTAVQPLLLGQTLLMDHGTPAFWDRMQTPPLSQDSHG